MQLDAAMLNSSAPAFESQEISGNLTADKQELQMQLDAAMLNSSALDFEGTEIPGNLPAEEQELQMQLDAAAMLDSSALDFESTEISGNLTADEQELQMQLDAAAMLDSSAVDFESTEISGNLSAEEQELRMQLDEKTDRPEEHHRFQSDLYKWARQEAAVDMFSSTKPEHTVLESTSSRRMRPLSKQSGKKWSQWATSSPAARLRRQQKRAHLQPSAKASSSSDPR